MRAALVAVWLALALLACSPGGEADAVDPRWQAHAKLGPGFLVWESSRSGSWRIWQRQLDGSGLRQVTPDEKDRNHFAPHISPDGRHLVYLSYPPGLNGYRRPRPDADVTLRILDLGSGDDRVLAPRARAYYEDRAAVWIDHRSLIYIAGDGSTRRIDVHSGAEEQLLPPRTEHHAFLIDPTLGHATTGRPAFGAYDPETRTVMATRPEPGCQPYFSRDGIWGYWVVRGGGPVRRIDLRTGERRDILLRDDPHLPDGFGYVYFPMVSPGQDLLAFGASGDDHDHFRADYEIFVAPIDPTNLELTGDPLRYTFHPATDRFPDVFRPGRELGTIRGEAPVQVRLEVPHALREGRWQWDLGDGARAEGARIEHTYAEPGTYGIVARRGERELGGRVVVEPPEPPRPLGSEVREGGSEVTVRFNERVALRDAAAHFEHAGPARSITVGPDGTSVRIEPARPVRGKDRLELEGIVDLAEPPHRMGLQVLEVEPHDWPSRSEGLFFLWRTGAHENRVRDAATGTDRSYPLEPRFGARLNRDHAMQVAGGGFRHKGFVELARRINATRAFSLELTLTAAQTSAEVPGVIAAYAAGADDRRFALMQEGDELVLYLRSVEGPPAGDRFVIARLPSAGPHHVVVSVRGNALQAFLDGALVLERKGLPLRLRRWAAADLAFGWERGGPNDWSGSIEGVALYDRALSAEEVADNAEAYLEEVRSRTPANTVDVRVRRVAAAAAPTLEEVLPYRNALVMHEYEVVEVLDGDLGEPRIRVAHWALLNGDTRPRAAAALGELVDLRIEAFSDHPEVQDVYLADDLPVDVQQPVFLEPGS